MDLHKNNACTFCWHSKGLNPLDTLVEMIEFEGGVLDKTKTCNQCHINYTLSLLCTNCTKNQPCTNHYASVYNGCKRTTMSTAMHLVYMRNSPYCPCWRSRPENIGYWYGVQVTNYVDALNTLSRMTNKKYVIEMIQSLCREVARAYHKRNVLWNGLYTICKEHFSGRDKCSRAVGTYYRTIIQRL